MQVNITRGKLEGIGFLSGSLFVSEICLIMNTPKAVRVFTGSGLITGSDRIGPEIGYLAHF